MRHRNASVLRVPNVISDSVAVARISTKVVACGLLSEQNFPLPITSSRRPKHSRPSSSSNKVREGQNQLTTEAKCSSLLAW
jgi:hypothetical protein